MTLDFKPSRYTLPPSADDPLTVTWQDAHQLRRLRPPFWAERLNFLNFFQILSAHFCWLLLQGTQQPGRLTCRSTPPLFGSQTKTPG